MYFAPQTLKPDYGPELLCTLLTPFLCVWMVIPVCQYFAALPLLQATWNARVSQRTSPFKALSISDRISSQPAAFPVFSIWQQGKFRLQWRYFARSNVPPVRPMVWQRLGSNGIWNTLSICQGCPFHCWVWHHFGLWWIEQYYFFGAKTPHDLPEYFWTGNIWNRRCRSRKIFGGAKELGPDFPKIAPKNFRPLFMQFSCDFGCHFFKSNHIGRHFYQIKASWAPFLLVFLWSLPRVSEIFKSFHKFCPDFHWFCPDFHQIKTFGGALAPPSPTPLIGI